MVLKDDLADWRWTWTAPLILKWLLTDAYDLVMKSSKTTGAEYCQEVARYQEERWVDF